MIPVLRKRSALFVVWLSVAGCSAAPMSEVPDAGAGIEVTLTEVSQYGSSLASTGADFSDERRLGFAGAVAEGGGYIFVVDPSLQALVRVDPEHGTVSILHNLQDPNTAGLYVADDLSVFVVDRSNRAVIQLDSSGGSIRKYYDRRHMPEPIDVTKSNWGATVLIADDLTQRLVTFDGISNLTGAMSATLTPVEVSASIRAITATNEFVFVLDDSSLEVPQLDLRGRIIDTYGEDALGIPSAFAVDDCHRIFVADSHIDGLYITSTDSFGDGFRAALPVNIAQSVTDLWVGGNRLYVAAGAMGVYVFDIFPACFGS
jgi:hypothetical protein